MKMKSFILENKWSFIFGFTGAVAGGLYAFFIGCDAGGCAITSSPLNSSVYGMVMGFLTGNVIKTENSQKE